MRRKLKAQFTVEAAILVPTLIFLVFVGSYLVIFAYNRSLMYQDMNSLTANLKISVEEFDRACQTIRTKRPYLGVSSPSIYVKKSGLIYEVTMKCDWEIPIWQGHERSIVVKRDISTVSPIEIMRMTDDIVSEVKNKDDK